MNHIAHRLQELSQKERNPVEEFVMQYCKSKLAPAVIFPPEGNYDREKSVPFPNFYHEPPPVYIARKGLCSYCYKLLKGHQNKRWCNVRCREDYKHQIKLRELVSHSHQV